MKEHLDLTGKRFGSWVVISPAPSDYSYERYWLCRCDCGTERRVNERTLLKGNSRSCGCAYKSQPHDLTGKRFGRLTAVRLADEYPSKKPRWVCKCDCGKTVIIYACNLVGGKTRSCGCIKTEKSRDFIASLKRDKTHEGIKNKTPRSKTGVKGVYFYPENNGKKYCAFMRFQGKIVLNKFFDTLGEASLAYREAEMKFREPILTKWAMEKNLKKQEENKNGKNDIWQLRNAGF